VCSFGHRPISLWLTAVRASKNMFYIYFLKSLKNNKIYVGFTSKSPKIRTEEHNNGSNTFTKNNRPWKLEYYEIFICEKCARAREKFFKSGIGKTLKK